MGAVRPVHRCWILVVALLAGSGLAGVAAPGAPGTPVVVAHQRVGAATSPAADRPGGLPDFGNPDGHFPVPAGGRAVDTSHPDHVIGKGTPASCTSAAVTKAVAAGGTITFDCGNAPVTILMTSTARVPNTSHLVVLDGGGLVTLSGGGKRRPCFLTPAPERGRPMIASTSSTRRSWCRTSPSKTASPTRTRPPARPTPPSAGTAASMAAAPFMLKGASSRRSTRASSGTGATVTARPRRRCHPCPRAVPEPAGVHHP